MATKKITKGYTLGQAAQEFGTTVDQIMSLNQGNPSVKSKNVIIEGGSLNVPDGSVKKTTPTTSSAPTGGPAGGPAGVSITAPSSAVPDGGMSASFLTDMGADLSAAAKELAKSSSDAAGLFPAPPAPGSPEEAASPEYQASQARKSQIKTEYELGRSEIKDTQAAGEISRNRAGELLGLSPAAISSRIKDFITQSDSFENGITRAIERLTQEENAALANEDASYASTVRQQKMDFYNFQRQVQQDKFTFLTQAFNMMLTGKQEQRQETQDAQTMATNRINMLLQGGTRNFDSLSQDMKDQLAKDADSLGVPLDTIKSMIQNPQAKFHVSKGDYTYFLDQSGNVIKTIYTPAQSTAGAGADFESYLRGNISSIPASSRAAVETQIQKIQDNVLGGMLWQERQKLSNLISTTKTSDFSTILQNKQVAIKNIVDKLSQDPKTVAQILGLNYSVGQVTPDMKDQLSKVVSDSADVVIPDTYLSNEFGRSKKPSFEDLLSGLGTAAPTDTTTDGQVTDVSGGAVQ